MLDPIALGNESCRHLVEESGHKYVFKYFSGEGRRSQVPLSDLDKPVTE